jgi:methionyl-tRNA formyltransferase
MQRIVYCGSLGNISDYIHLSERFELIAIICEENKVSSEILTFSFIRKIPLRVVRTYGDFRKVVIEIGSNPIYLLCGFGIIIKRELLELNNFFNIHPSRLPDYKGRHPTHRATLNGETHGLHFTK